MTAVTAVTTLGPSEFVSDCTRMLDREKIICVMPAGRPRRTMRPVMGLSRRRVERFISMVSRMRYSLRRHSTADMPCARMVAQATPSVVMPSRVIKAISSTMFSPEATSR